MASRGMDVPSLALLLGGSVGLLGALACRSSCRGIPEPEPSDEELAQAEFEEVAQPLEGRPHWDLSDQRLGDLHAKLLAEVLSGDQVLESLKLNRNEITDAGVEHIAKALHGNTVLRKLLLNGNKIGDTGARAMAAALRVNDSLRELELHGNVIGNAGIESLAAALRENQTLQFLGVSHSGLSESRRDLLKSSAGVRTKVIV